MINVTKTYLPDKEKYKHYVDEIYKTGWITNNGPLVQRLEKELANYLGVKNIILVANGTVALEIAFRTLGIKNDVITTPFSFVATTSSLVTNALKPVYADINPQTLNIDPANIANSITWNTDAIVPVHIFGNACEVERIVDIAKQHHLKVIFDASHAFGVRYKDQSILNFGDISTLSFHATKLFHTIEGGALVINDDNLVKKARYLINFGIENTESIPELGTNAKMNEFEAAMGLCMLDDVDVLIEKRKFLIERYEDSLRNILQLQQKNELSNPGYSYFPVIFKTESQREIIQNKLNLSGIFPRRYFFPSLDTLDYIKPEQIMPNARDIASRILCLPLYPDLTTDQQQLIIDVILKNRYLFK